MTSSESLDRIVRASRDSGGSAATPWIKVTPCLEPRHRELLLCMLTRVQRLLVALKVTSVLSHLTHVSAFVFKILVLFKPLILSIYSNSRRRQGCLYLLLIFDESSSCPKVQLLIWTIIVRMCW